MKGRERETPSGLRLGEVRLEPFYAALHLGARFCRAIGDHTAQGGLAAPVRDVRQDREVRWGSEEQSYYPGSWFNGAKKKVTRVQ